MIISLDSFFILAAIEPAGLLYDLFPRAFRLHRSQTDFLQVLSTDRMGVGTSRILGHVNFLMNEGTDQPGCDDRGDTCSHGRASYIAIDSVLNCNFRFVLGCSSKHAFLHGLCSHLPELTFGFGIDKEAALAQSEKSPRIYYYFSDHIERPFCLEKDYASPTFDGVLC
ncbi:lipase member H-B isoform X1 [Aplysia californica]|uniref:Lipase member H-B isoform X1 n=2 Tax=Aplysia californica TaxID=6500 RepID=A0ABM1VRG7_APLCA|nr:lipase member H-B isoform X1 [Aplysia californica]